MLQQNNERYLDNKMSLKLKGIYQLKLFYLLKYTHREKAP